MSPLEMHGRHGAHRPSAPAMWACPACGAENTGPLEQGCASCGSGKPGAHVGVQPPSDPPVLNRAPATPESLISIDEAFVQWKKTEPGRLAELDPTVIVLVYRAFQAGYQMGSAAVADMRQPLTGTAESRTVIAALKVFRDSVLVDAREEIESGEFLSLEAVDALIKRLEREY